MHIIITFVITFGGALILYPRFIRRLRRSKISGVDQNKPDRPEVAEMGGLVIISCFALGMLSNIGIANFGRPPDHVDTVKLMATLAAVLIVGFLGVIDDLIDMRKPVKVVAPVVAALPLVAVKAGVTSLYVPFLGMVDLGLVYPLVIVPIGMTGAVNAANILAGYNGLEAGLGVIAASALAVITYTSGQHTAFLALLCLIGPLLATLWYNWYPARVFIGDVGTLSIGAVLCSACVLGNCETAGVIVMIPHGIDFIFKIAHRLPSATWGEYRDGKLHCPAGKPQGLAQLVLKLSGGLKEPTVVMTLLALELVCAAAAVAIYGKFGGHH